MKEIVMIEKTFLSEFDFEKRGDSMIWHWKNKINSDPSNFSADSKSWLLFNGTEYSRLSDLRNQLLKFVKFLYIFIVTCLYDNKLIDYKNCEQLNISPVGKKHFNLICLILEK